MAEPPDAMSRGEQAAASLPADQIAVPTIASLRVALEACGVVATDDELEELLPGVTTILSWATPAASVAEDVQPIFMGPLPGVPR